MNAEFFLDTNVFVYSFDVREKRKLARARQLVREALDGRRGTISWQVVQEFLSVALHRFTQPLATAEAEDYLLTVLSPLCRVFPSAQLYREALLIQKETRFHFYDALIVASAAASGARTLYSEDLQHGRKLRGLTIQDPFRQEA